MNRRKMLKVSGALAGAVVAAAVPPAHADEKTGKSSREIRTNFSILIDTPTLVVGKSGPIAAQLGNFNSTAIIDLGFAPKQVLAILSDVDTDRGKDSIKMSKIKFGVISSLIGPGNEVKVEYMLRFGDDSNNWNGGSGRITLFLTR